MINSAPLSNAVDAATKIAAAVSGPDTPDQVKMVQRDDRLAVWMRSLSGPAITLLLIANVVLLTWGIKVGVWTSASEIVRAQVVGVVAIVLAASLGLVVWVTHVGRPSRMEIGAGPASLKIEQGSDE